MINIYYAETTLSREDGEILYSLESDNENEYGIKDIIFQDKYLYKKDEPDLEDKIKKHIISRHNLNLSLGINLKKVKFQWV